MAELFNIAHPNVPADAVSIMRPSPWGNPYPIDVKRGIGRLTAIRLYEHHLATHPDLVRRMRQQLAGKDLTCCCWPLACHGDVILKVLAGEEPAPLSEDDPARAFLKV